MTDKHRGDKENNGRVLSFERDTSFFVKRGDKKRSQNDPVNALAMYTEALERDPRDFAVRLSAAEILTDISRFNDSNKLIIPFMHLDADFCTEAYCIAGFNLLGMGENEGAKLCFERFFELSNEASDRTDAILDALDYINSFETEPALADALEADYAEKTNNAFTAFENGDFERAEKELRKLEPAFPDDTGVIYRLALSCICQYRYREANEYLERLLKKSPDNLGALSMKLMCARSLGNEIEASMLIKKLEKCDSDSPEELLKVNGALLEAGAYEASVKVASRALQLMPYDTLANHRMGVGLIKLGQFKRAADVYDKLVKLDRGDRIARYYRTACAEADEKPDSEFLKLPIMIHYQLPFADMMEEVKKLLSGNDRLDLEQLREKWRTDADFRDLVRWSFTLREFNITHAMLTILRLLNDERAETLLREVIADIEVRDSVINEALGALKSLGAAEPYFAVSNGRLLEGRVTVIDLSDERIPKGYREIFPRIQENSREVLDSELLSVACGISERFIMCVKDELKPITRAQSEALSAAVELLSCERCGVAPRDDLLERYGVTERRLKNAVARIVAAFDKKPNDTEDGTDE
ncbi:MAG: hypothetical protein IKP26_05145 [Clostridia bacterium]|nr:hypothetical protein [Clostridia bacterium]